MAYSLTWLPDVLKNAGLKVAECPGWEHRGHGDMGTVKGVICHHTATPTLAGNMPTLNTLISGRSDLPGPLSQLGLGRDGTYYIVAAGKCNHAGQGMWQGIVTGNTSFIGIEAENPGTKSSPWPDIQLDAYYRGVAAILQHISKGPEYCAGHKEWALPAGRKTDPSLDMEDFRNRVSNIMKGTTPPLVRIPDAEPLQGRPTLRRSLNNDAKYVKELQADLGIVPADGIFGPFTEAEIRKFQAAHGKVPDGIVGPKTWAAIDEFVKVKLT